jgi:hypothetical protein
VGDSPDSKELGENGGGLDTEDGGEVAWLRVKNEVKEEAVMPRFQVILGHGAIVAWGACKMVAWGIMGVARGRARKVRSSSSRACYRATGGGKAPLPAVPLRKPTRVPSGPPSLARPLFPLIG